MAPVESPELAAPAPREMAAVRLSATVVETLSLAVAAPRPQAAMARTTLAVQVAGELSATEGAPAMAGSVAWVATGGTGAHLARVAFRLAPEVPARPRVESPVLAELAVPPGIPVRAALRPP